MKNTSSLHLRKSPLLSNLKQSSDARRIKRPASSLDDSEKRTTNPIVIIRGRHEWTISCVLFETLMTNFSTYSTNHLHTHLITQLFNSLHLAPPPRDLTIAKLFSDRLINRLHEQLSDIIHKRLRSALSKGTATLTLEGWEDSSGGSTVNEFRRPQGPSRSQSYIYHPSSTLSRIEEKKTFANIFIKNSAHFPLMVDDNSVI